MNNLPERLRCHKSKDNINNLKHIHLFNIKTKSENYLKKKNNRYRIQCKKNIISLLEFYILLNRKMKKLNESYQLIKSKYFWQKEKRSASQNADLPAVKPVFTFSFYRVSSICRSLSQVLPVSQYPR